MYKKKKKKSRHDIVEIMQKLALNTKRSKNKSLLYFTEICFSPQKSKTKTKKGEKKKEKRNTERKTGKKQR